MIDIHTHILPLVDDGSNSVENSIAMLKDLYNDGVTDCILTPHFRGAYKLSVEELRKRFSEFNDTVKELNIPVNLYLGQEIYASKNTKKHLTENEVLTLNDSKYILLEFDYHGYCEIAEFVYEFKTMGYIPIVAHIERYDYISIDDIKEIKGIGGLIQINASSLVGKTKNLFKKKIKKYLKAKLVDFVASDIHINRGFHMTEAKKYIAKKYGTEYAETVFEENAKLII